MNILLIDPVAGNRRLMQVWIKGTLPSGHRAAIAFSEATGWEEARKAFSEQSFHVVFLAGQCVAKAVDTMVKDGPLWPESAVYLVGAAPDVELESRLADALFLRGVLSWPVGKQGMKTVLEAVLTGAPDMLSSGMPDEPSDMPPNMPSDVLAHSNSDASPNLPNLPNLHVAPDTPDTPDISGTPDTPVDTTEMTSLADVTQDSAETAPTDDPLAGMRAEYQELQHKLASSLEELTVTLKIQLADVLAQVPNGVPDEVTDSLAGGQLGGASDDVPSVMPHVMSGVTSGVTSGETSDVTPGVTSGNTVGENAGENVYEHVAKQANGQAKGQVLLKGTRPIVEQGFIDGVTSACQTAHSLKGVAMTFNLLHLIPPARDLHDQLGALQNTSQIMDKGNSITRCLLCFERVESVVKRIRNAVAG